MPLGVQAGNGHSRSTGMREVKLTEERAPRCNMHASSKISMPPSNIRQGTISVCMRRGLRMACQGTVY